MYNGSGDGNFCFMPVEHFRAEHFANLVHLQSAEDGFESLSELCLRNAIEPTIVIRQVPRR